MDQSLLQELKTKLETEKEEIERELKEVSIKTDAGYEPKITDFGSDTEDYESAEADEAEDLGASLAVKQVLETRLHHIESALRKMESGAYGLCESCKKEIANRSLEIDPARPFCLDCTKE